METHLKRGKEDIRRRDEVGGGMTQRDDSCTWWHVPSPHTAGKSLSSCAWEWFVRYLVMWLSNIMSRDCQVMRCPMLISFKLQASSFQRFHAMNTTKRVMCTCHFKCGGLYYVNEEGKRVPGQLVAPSTCTKHCSKDAGAMKGPFNSDRWWGCYPLRKEERVRHRYYTNYTNGSFVTWLCN